MQGKYPGIEVLILDWDINNIWATEYIQKEQNVLIKRLISCYSYMEQFITMQIEFRNV